MFNMKSKAICLLLGFTSSLAFPTAEEVLQSPLRRRLAGAHRRLVHPARGRPALNAESKTAVGGDTEEPEGSGTLTVIPGAEPAAVKKSLPAGLLTVGAVGVMFAAFGTALQFGELSQELSSKVTEKNYSPEWMAFGIGMAGTIVAFIFLMLAFFKYTEKGAFRNTLLGTTSFSGLLIFGGLIMSAVSHDSAGLAAATKIVMCGGAAVLVIAILMFAFKNANITLSLDKIVFAISVIALVAGASLAGYHLQEGIYDVHNKTSSGHEGIDQGAVILTGILLVGGLLALGLFMMVSQNKENRKCGNMAGMTLGTALMAGSGVCLALAMDGMKDYVVSNGLGNTNNVTPGDADDISNFMSKEATLFIIAGALLVLGLIITLSFRFGGKCNKPVAAMD